MDEPKQHGTRKAGQETREARLAKALRENLRRRKTQAKSRGGAAPVGADDNGQKDGD